MNVKVNTLICLLFILVPTSVFAQQCPASIFLRGDVDKNQKVDITDAIFIIQYLFLAGESPACLKAADSNDDGEINLSDPIYILRYLYQGQSQPLAPFPVAGIDPTTDNLSCVKPIQYLTFEKIFPSESVIDSWHDVIQLENGDYLLAGFQAKEGDPVEEYFTRLNAAGDKVLWTIKGDTGKRTFVYKLLKAPDGGYLGIGLKEYNTKDLENTYIYMVKINEQGEVLWRKEHGDGRVMIFSDITYAAGSDGYVITARKDYSPLSVRSTIYVLKVDLKGDKVWDAIYPITHAPCDDGKDNDNDGKIDLDDPGCFNLQDDTDEIDARGPACNDGLDNDQDGTIDCWQGQDAFPPGRGDEACDGGWEGLTGKDRCLQRNYEWSSIRFDSSGDGIAKSFDSNGNTDGYMVLATVTEDGRTYMTLLKIDLNGREIWHKYVIDANHEEPHQSPRGKLLETRDKNFLIIGGYWPWQSEIEMNQHMGLPLVSDRLFYKFNSQGQQLWQKLYKEDYTHSFAGAIELEGGDLLVNYDTPSPSKLMRYDKLGSLLWTREFGTGKVGYTYAVKQTVDGGYVLPGVQIGPSGLYQSYLIKTDPMGCVENAQ